MKSWIKPVALALVAPIIGVLLWFPYDALVTRLEQIEKLAANHLAHVMEDIREIRADIKEILKSRK